MRISVLFCLLALLAWSCGDSMISDSSSQMMSSKELQVSSSKKTIVPSYGKIQVVKDSFLFFAPNNNQGFFLYPQTDIQLFRTHFYVQLNAYDVITCGVIERTTSKRKLTVKAEISKYYYGDISGVASFCSGKGAYLYTTDGKKTRAIKSTLIRNSKLLESGPYLIFPYIPYFGESLDSIASPGNEKTKLYVKIQFFDRISKSTLTNCTTYTIDGESDATCYGVPIIYPEISLYGKKYKSMQLRPVKALSEYLERTTES